MSSSERDLEAATATPERGSHAMGELNVEPSVRRSRDGKPEYKLAGLPRLDYNIMHYKLKLFIVSGLLLFEGSIAPVIFYYALTLGTDLREGIGESLLTTTLRNWAVHRSTQASMYSGPGAALLPKSRVKNGLRMWF